VILGQGERDRVHRDHDLGILDKAAELGDDLVASRANSTVFSHASHRRTSFLGSLRLTNLAYTEPSRPQTMTFLKVGPVFGEIRINARPKWSVARA
jgi:hypothetical protein